MLLICYWGEGGSRDHGGPGICTAFYPLNYDHCVAICTSYWHNGLISEIGSLLALNVPHNHIPYVTLASWPFGLLVTTHFYHLL